MASLNGSGLDRGKLQKVVESNLMIRSSWKGARLDRGKNGVLECTLSSDLWATLPESLVDEILAKVPKFSSLVRLCSVCKRWRDLILHSNISPRCTSDHGHLCLFSNGKLTTFNPGRGTWETVPLPFLQRQFTLLDLVSSAGGLLCFSTVVVGEYIVCNPLTKSFKRLQMPCSNTSRLVPWIRDQPCMPTASMPTASAFYRNEAGESLKAFLVGMVLLPDTGHFKLIVAGLFLPSGGTTLVYDSHSNIWKKVGNISDDVPWNCGSSRETVRMACDGNLYVHFWRNSNRLFKYDVEQEEWSSILFPQELQGKVENITEFKGKILLVTLDHKLDKMQRTAQKKFTVFELQETPGSNTELQENPGSKLWLPTDTLPLPAVCEALSAEKDSKCLGQGDVMFIVTGVNTGFKTFPRSDIDLNGSRACASRHSIIVRVREWFHNVVTKSYSEVTSNYWEEFEGDNFWEDFEGDVNLSLRHPDFHIFRPSMLDVKVGGKLLR